MIASAVPAGSIQVSHTLQAWRALHELPGFALARRDHQRTLRHVLTVLIRCTTFETMTARVSRTTLMAKTGRSRSTIDRAMRTLRAWGLLGIVASGRQAAYASRGLDGQKINETSVYVLCRPAGRGLRPVPVLPEHAAAVDQREQSARLMAVDKKETPPAKQVVTYEGNSHPHARESKSTQEPLRGHHSTGRGVAAAHPPHPADRTELTWPRHATISTDAQCLAGVSTIRNLMSALRPFTLRDLRSLMRPFFEAGWTVADVQHALDSLPKQNTATGQHQWNALPLPHPHEHPTQWRIRVREMIRYRLSQWITPDGEVMRSYDQRLHGERAALHAQAQAGYERRARAEALRQTRSPEASARAAQVRQFLRDLPTPAWAK